MKAESLEPLMVLAEEAVMFVNDMKRGGVIEDYAIGGGIAANYYVEPIATRDVDFFVFLPASEGKLVDLSGIYECAAERGYPTDGLDIRVGEVPIQFLPAYDDLTEEAVEEAVDVMCGATPTRVFRIEHVLAVMVQTYRDKDRDRIPMMTRRPNVDRVLLENVLRRHGLWERWNKFWGQRRDEA